MLSKLLSTRVHVRCTWAPAMEFQLHMSYTMLLHLLSNEITKPTTNMNLAQLPRLKHIFDVLPGRITTTLRTVGAGSETACVSLCFKSGHMLLLSIILICIDEVVTDGAVRFSSELIDLSTTQTNAIRGSDENHRRIRFCAYESR